MSKVQTDNDAKYLDVKVQIRQNIIDQLQGDINVLEAFGGDGVIWSILKRENQRAIHVLRIDQKEDKKGVYLKGDNIKFLQNIDLTAFNIIDLDAYGVPYKQLKILFDRGYKGWVAVTFIQTMTGALNKDFLLSLGYTPSMIKKCPSLFNKDGFTKMKAFLAKNGVKTIEFFSENRKNYFTFYLANLLEMNNLCHT